MIYRWHLYAEEMQEFCKAMGIEYFGESQASFTLRVLILLLKMKRRTLPESEKQSISAAQDGRCGMCAGIVDKGDEEFDHISPLRDLSSKKQEKLQLLCSACHAEKTAEEPRCERDPLRSAFNQTAYEAYVLSPRVPQLQFNAFTPQQFAGELAEIDVRRCRRQALYHSAHPFPVFSVVDNVKPCTCDLGELNYIDKGECKTMSRLLDALP